jgi:hypothetical protein
MNFFLVKSTNVTAIAYDAQTQVLGVLYARKQPQEVAKDTREGAEASERNLGTELYFYPNVQPTLWKGLIAPGVSIGSYLNENVKKLPSFQIAGLLRIDFVTQLLEGNQAAAG